MVVEVYLRKNQANEDESVENLPDSLLELEMMKGEVLHSLEKLKESTDLLIEEFRKTSENDAMELYEYIQDNLDIIKTKNGKLERISARINQKKGLFHSLNTDGDTSRGAGGLIDSHDEGHFI
jgi:seryl-tRNA synthetase